MSVSGARAVAPSFQARLDFGHLGLLDVWDSEDVVNRPARNSKFVSREPNDVVTCNGAALCLAGKSHDTGVTLTIQGNNHVRLRGNGRRLRIRRVCRRSATGEQNKNRGEGEYCANVNHGRNRSLLSHGWIYFICDPIESNHSGKYRRLR
jgi:hypothetical protein